MINTGLTYKEVNQEIAETDLSKIAALFDSVDDLCEQFGLSKADKADSDTQVFFILRTCLDRLTGFQMQYQSFQSWSWCQWQCSQCLDPSTALLTTWLVVGPLNTNLCVYKQL